MVEEKTTVVVKDNFEMKNEKAKHKLKDVKESSLRVKSTEGPDR